MVPRICYLFCFNSGDFENLTLFIHHIEEIYNGRKFKHKKENNGSLRFTQMGLFRFTASFINSFDIFDIKTGKMLDSKQFTTQILLVFNFIL